MIENYTLSCPCKGIIIEGALVRVHGGSHIPSVGAYVGCPCGCLHRVHLVEEAARLIALAVLTHDEQIEAYRALGHDMVKVSCPHCDAVHATELPEFRETFEPLDMFFECPDCHHEFIAEGRDGDGLALRTRVMTDAERAELREIRAAASRSRAFGWTSGGGA